MENKLIFGYDILTYNGELPNCLNSKFINSIHTASDFDYQYSGPFLSKRWGCNWAVYNSNFFEKVSEKKSLHQIKEDRRNGINYDWFYIVEPFGNLEQFFGNDEVHEFALNFMSKIAIDEIKNGNGKLFFNYIIDGGNGVYLENFEKIIRFINEKQIPEEKVYFLFADFKLKKNFEKLGLKYKVWDYSLNMVAKSQEFNNLINDPNWKYWGEGADEPQVGAIKSVKSSIASEEEFLQSIGNDKKDFLMLNRHWKLHRLLLLSVLHRLGLENSLVSWDNQFYHIDSITELLMHDNNTDLATLITETSSLLDIQDLTKIAGYGFEDKNLYLNSYLSIVTESIFFQCKVEVNNIYAEEGDNIYVKFPTGYISEKLWKPIGHCQPFILAAPAKSLQYIRRRFGFKTFHPFIDESYDLECDDFARLRMIELEINKFATKTKEEKDEFLNNVKEICIYNQKKFLEYGVNSWKEPKQNKELQLIVKFLNDDNRVII